MFRLFLTFCFCSFALIGDAVAQPLSQTLPRGWDSTPTGSATTRPFDSSSDQRWQWVYDASEFDCAGEIEITEIHVRCANPAGAAGASIADLTIRLGTTGSSYGLSGQSSWFHLNYIDHVSPVRSGPWASGPVPAATSGATVGSWIALGLQSPYTFRPTPGHSLIVEIRSCGVMAPLGASIDGVGGSPGENGGNRYGHTTSCASGTRNFSNNEWVPVIRIDFNVVKPAWQTNHSGCAMDIDGLTGDGCDIAVVERCPGTVVQFTQTTSTGIGHPWETAMTFLSGPISTAAGAHETADGQHFHLNVNDPTMFGVNLGFTTPHPGVLSFPVTIPANAPPVALQGIQYDPTMISEISYSQPMVVRPIGTPSVVGPMSDDGWVEIFPNAPPLCLPAPVSFVGTSWTSFFVNSNGSVSFGTGSSDFFATPSSFVAGPPRIAPMWSDHMPQVAGTITTSVTGSTITTAWQGVTQWNSFFVPSTSSSFAAWFDTQSGACGISSYQPHISHTLSTLVGLAPGPGATDPSNLAGLSFAALVGSGLQTGAATDAVYTWSPSSAPTGFTSVDFPTSDGSAFVIN